MPQSTCSINGCDRKGPYTRKMCPAHYQRWLKGIPLDTPIKKLQKRDGPCTFAGCDRPQWGKGLCSPHWQQRYKLGIELKPVRDTITPETRFWQKVNKSGPIPELVPDLGPCWVWVGNIHQGSGYGSLSINNKRTAAHRFSYELHKGKIPEGMHIDHICGTRPCVNPEHLRLATPKQNSENKRGPNKDKQTPGGLGVYPSNNRTRYRAAIRHNGPLIYLGTFDTPEQAMAARLDAERRYFTHSTRGPGRPDFDGGVAA